MKKQIFFNNLKKVRREERQSAVQTSASLYFNSNYSSASGILRLHSNLLNKADFDGKRGLLFHQITSASLNTFDCLHQFRGFYCGKLFHLLAHHCNIYSDVYSECTLPRHMADEENTVSPRDPPSAEILTKPDRKCICTASSLLFSFFKNAIIITAQINRIRTHKI